MFLSGLSCKNRQCDMLFETAVAKRGIHAATRLVVAADEEDDVIGQNDEVFSVKLKSRSNPEQRGFVKVRRRRGGTGPGSAAEQVCVFCNLSDCVHVVACAPSSEESPPTTKESVPCSVKQSVLNSMSISGEWKHKIWLTARDYGPLAQRVSKSTVRTSPLLQNRRSKDRLVVIQTFFSICIKTLAKSKLKQKVKENFLSNSQQRSPYFLE